MDAPKQCPLCGCSRFHACCVEDIPPGLNKWFAFAKHIDNEHAMLVDGRNHGLWWCYCGREFGDASEGAHRLTDHLRSFTDEETLVTHLALAAIAHMGE